MADFHQCAAIAPDQHGEMALRGGAPDACRHLSTRRLGLQQQEHRESGLGLIQYQLHRLPYLLVVSRLWQMSHPREHYQICSRDGLREVHAVSRRE